MSTILVVDDELGIRKSLSVLLAREGYNVLTAANGIDALKEARTKQIDLLITDIRMAPVTGMELLQEIKKLYPAMEVIMMTAYGSIESAVSAMKAGAFDYITKPFNSSELLLRVTRALEKRAISRRLSQLEEELRSTRKFFGMIGKSKAIYEIFDSILRVAPTDSTVLITGESGTGKELVANALHQLSVRKRKQIVTINCAALPETLLESELFGYEKGAFTGAGSAKKGLFEEADNGTIFLDEVLSTPKSIQAKLLRVLESGEIRRLGSTKSRRVNVRIIAATNRELETAVSSGNFREDLLYRLKVVEIHLPPLRERKEDIPLLTQHFFNIYRDRMQRRLKDISPEAMELILKYPYPGNIRELENIIEHSVAVAKAESIMPDDLPAFCRNSDGALSEMENIDNLTLQEMERRMILRKLKDNSNNLNIVAKELGISRTTLWRKMKELRLNKGGIFKF